MFEIHLTLFSVCSEEAQTICLKISTVSLLILLSLCAKIPIRVAFGLNRFYYLWGQYFFYQVLLVIQHGQRLKELVHLSSWYTMKLFSNLGDHFIDIDCLLFTFQFLQFYLHFSEIVLRQIKLGFCCFPRLYIPIKGFRCDMSYGSFVLAMGNHPKWLVYLKH